jgi:putative hydrolase of the HAD superfamily
MPPRADPRPARAERARPRGLLLDIGGVLHATGSYLVTRMAEREPAVRRVLERIGGISSERDELWQRMLRRELTEREYWARRAAELGAALGETWDTRAMIERLYELPQRDWLRGDVVDLMADTRAAGMPVGALTNDMARFHGQEWVDRQDHLKLFDVVIDASVTGVLKPDPRAFLDAARALGLPPRQVVFLDDMPGNVEGARAVGLIAVRVPWDDPAPAVDAARDLLGLPRRRARTQPGPPHHEPFQHQQPQHRQPQHQPARGST